MNITQLVELLESTREAHGDLEVRAGDSNAVLSEARKVTGLWILPDPIQGIPYLKLSVPSRRSQYFEEAA